MSSDEAIPAGGVSSLLEMQRRRLDGEATNRDILLDTQDRVVEIQGRLLDEIARGTRHGVKEALADPETWALAAKAIKDHANKEAGSWLFGGLRTVFARIAWVLVIGMGIYMLGGWSALMKFLHSIGGST